MNNDTSKALPRRDEIAKEHQWELGDIYTSLALWEADFQRLKELVGEIQKHQDHVTDSATTLLKVLTLRDEIGRLLDKLFVFARMHKDEDNANPEYQSLTDRIQGLASEVGGALAFIVPSFGGVASGKANNLLGGEFGVTGLSTFFCRDRTAATAYLEYP